MKITVEIDDDLYQKALDVAGPSIDKANLFQEAIKTFIRIKASKRLAALRASSPKINNIKRSRIMDHNQ